MTFWVLCWQFMNDGNHIWPNFWTICCYSKVYTKIKSTEEPKSYLLLLLFVIIRYLQFLIPVVPIKVLPNSELCFCWWITWLHFVFFGIYNCWKPNRFIGCFLMVPSDLPSVCQSWVEVDFCPINIKKSYSRFTVCLILRYWVPSK